MQSEILRIGREPRDEEERAARGGAAGMIRSRVEVDAGLIKPCCNSPE